MLDFGRCHNGEDLANLRQNQNREKKDGKSAHMPNVFCLWDFWN